MDKRTALTIKLWRDWPDNHINFDEQIDYAPLKFKGGYVYLMCDENEHRTTEANARKLWRHAPTMKELDTFEFDEYFDSAVLYGKGKKKSFEIGCKSVLVSELDAIAKQRKWKR